LIEFGAGTIPGFQLVTPLNQPNGITSFLLPASIEEKLIQLTKEANIAIIKRGNFIRVSIHAFCNESEVDHLLALIKMSLIQSSPQ
jgi:selenocysteine lyase/cysteine desulfurase